MKPALRDNHLLEPASWQDFRQGTALAEAISKQIAPWWQQIFGYYLLKVGNLSCQIDTSETRLSHQISLGAEVVDPLVIAEPDALPISANSIDAVMLTHCIEFQPDPHHVIREAHRVLIADGYLLLTGFNPHSAVGMGRFLPGLGRIYPWQGHFFSASRVKDWLHLIGFEVLAEQRFFNSAMLAMEYRQGRWQRFSERYLRYFASSYLLVARKRELPLTPIRPKWHVKRDFRATQGVSAREGVQSKPL